MMDKFTEAYIEAALWSSTLEPFGECPACGKEDRILNRWRDYGEFVCEECSDDEPNWEPPADKNYTRDDIAPEALEQMAKDCAEFQERAANIRTAGMEAPPLGSNDVAPRAAHNFGLTRNGQGAGFWDGDWREP